MRCSRLVALLAIPVQASLAQQAPAPAAPASATALTLEDAITIARRNNPAFLQTSNNLKTADAQVRAAYGGLLPSSNASFSARYQQGGSQYYQGVQLGSNSDTRQSSYSLGLNYNIGASTLINPRAARASRDATEANITGAAETLRSGIEQQYITVLQAQARAALQDSLVVVAQGQLDLAKAKTAVGAGTALDVSRAEVALGQAQVSALTEHNAADVEMLRLYQDMGVPKPDSVELTTRFVVADPGFSLDSLLQLARRSNPALAALHSNETASSLNVQVARSQYTPTLSLSTGWGGNSFEYADPEFLVNQSAAGVARQYGSCMMFDSLRTRAGMSSLDCGSPTLSANEMAAIRSSNNNFPFKFTRAPLGVSAFLSIPVFDNFRREQSVEQAKVQRENVRYDLRARELQLTTEVTQSYLSLMTALKTVQLQEQNAAKSREELSFAEERYKVGAATFLDVTTARGEYERAQIDRVNSIYDYHKTFAALESAVGRPLR